MVLRRFGVVAALLAAVCCGGLLTGCASEENDSDYDYEEKKALDYWNKDYKADDYEWQDITDDIDENMDKIIGNWKTVIEYTSDNCKVTDFIGYYTSLEFVVDDSFENCKFTFITDSSKCKSKYYNRNVYERFSEEFVNGEGYTYTLNYGDKNYIATATAENLTLDQLAEVLRCDGFSISTTGDRLLLRNRSDDTQDHPATWIFSASNGSTGYVIARAE